MDPSDLLSYIKQIENINLRSNDEEIPYEEFDETFDSLEISKIMDLDWSPLLEKRDQLISEFDVNFEEMMRSKFPIPEIKELMGIELPRLAKTFTDDFENFQNSVFLLNDKVLKILKNYEKSKMFSKYLQTYVEPFILFLDAYQIYTLFSEKEKIFYEKIDDVVRFNVDREWFVFGDVLYCDVDLVKINDYHVAKEDGQVAIVVKGVFVEVANVNVLKRKSILAIVGSVEEIKFEIGMWKFSGTVYLECSRVMECDQKYRYHVDNIIGFESSLEVELKDGFFSFRGNGRIFFNK